MPRYFFHVVEDEREVDPVGMELSDDTHAQIEAVRFAGEVLRSSPRTFLTTRQMRVEVTDESGVLCWSFLSVAVDAPAFGRTAV